MSDPEASMPTQPAPPLPPEQRNGCGTAMLLMFGVILLVPGVLCVSIDPRGMFPLTGLAFIIAGTGLLMIIFAIGRMMRRKP